MREITAMVSARGEEGAPILDRLPRRRPRPPWPPQPLLDLAAGRDPGDPGLTPELLTIAFDHRMGGLLWGWAKRHAPASDAKVELAVHDLKVRAHLLRLRSLLETCVTRLAEVGIEVASIKGPITEDRWYDGPGTRPCADVDLWLSPYQLDRAGDALLALQPDHPWAGFFGALAVDRKVQTVTLQVDGIEVDLHLDLLKTGMWMRDPAAVWEASERFRLPRGAEVRVLEPAAALVHFLVHLNKDRFQRLLSYADVARIMARPVDWGSMWALAEREGLTTVVASSLRTVGDDLLLDLPEGARPAGATSGLRASIWNLVWRRQIRLRGIEGRRRFRYRQLLIPLLSTRELVATLAALAEKVSPPPEVRAAQSPAKRPTVVTDSRANDVVELTPTIQIVRGTRVVANDLSENEVVVLDVDQGVYLGLREVGAAIWQLLDEPKTPAEIAEIVLKKYEVEEETCRRDVHEFLENLLKAGLADVYDPPTGS